MNVIRVGEETSAVVFIVYICLNKVYNSILRRGRCYCQLVSADRCLAVGNTVNLVVFQIGICKGLGRSIFVLEDVLVGFRSRAEKLFFIKFLVMTCNSLFVLVIVFSDSGANRR